MAKLVAYFSASGVTKSVAEKLAGAIDADIFEIRPKVPYSKEDLDWTNGSSRSSVEMKDASCRPEIVETADVSKYDVIYIGFPIWWYTIPRIIMTFLESADFSGKRVVPFGTSVGSGMCDSSEIIQACLPDSEVTEGRRFEATLSVPEMKMWAEQYTV